MIQNITSDFGRMIILTGDGADRLRNRLSNQFPPNEVLDLADRYNITEDVRILSFHQELVGKHLIVMDGDFSVNLGARLCKIGSGMVPIRTIIEILGYAGPFNIVVCCTTPLLSKQYFDRGTLRRIHYYHVDNELVTREEQLEYRPDQFIQEFVSRTSYWEYQWALVSDYIPDSELQNIKEAKTIELLLLEGPFYGQVKNDIFAQIFADNEKHRLLRKLRSIVLLELSDYVPLETSEVITEILKERELRFKLLQWRKVVSSEAKKYGYLNRKLALKNDQSVML